MHDNLKGIENIRDRRKIQNRLSQRKRRELLKRNSIGEYQGPARDGIDSGDAGPSFCFDPSHYHLGTFEAEQGFNSQSFDNPPSSLEVGIVPTSQILPAATFFQQIFHDVADNGSLDNLAFVPFSDFLFDDSLTPHRIEGREILESDKVNLISGSAPVSERQNCANEVLAWKETSDSTANYPGERCNPPLSHTSREQTGKSKQSARNHKTRRTASGAEQSAKIPTKAGSSKLPGSQATNKLEMKVNQMIDRLASLYEFSVEMEISSEDRGITDLLQELRNRFMVIIKVDSEDLA